MVCSIDWNPTQQDEIAFIKQDGYWGTVANFLKDAPIKTATAVPQTEKNVCTYLFLIFFMLILITLSTCKVASRSTRYYSGNQVWGCHKPRHVSIHKFKKFGF